MSTYHLLHLLQLSKTTFSEWVMWLVAPESMIQKLSKVLPKAFNSIEVGSSPEYANKKRSKFFNERSYPLNLFLVDPTSSNHSPSVYALWFKHQASSL